MPVTLSRKARERITETVGLDPEDIRTARFIDRVEQWLGAYCGAVAALDDEPRPGHYADVFERMQRLATTTQKNASDLFELVRGMNGRVRAQIIANNGDEARIQRALAELVDVATRANRIAVVAESRGRPKKRALAAICEKLLLIFNEFVDADEVDSEKLKEYLGPDLNYAPKTKTSKVVVPLSERELEAREFLQVALKEVGISASDRDIRAFILEARKALIK